MKNVIKWKFLLLSIVCYLIVIPMHSFSVSRENMKILCITHADFERPGVIADWAHQREYEFVECKPYAGENCLDVEDFDFLVVMGGPQDAADYDKVSYLSDEVTLIKRAIDANKIVVGFCLGAQLIGEALGAKTEKSDQKEVGVYPIFATEYALSDSIVKALGEEFLAIHWHNDMPGLTKDAKVLAYSAGCPRQIIKYADYVYGFQCHLEITQQGMDTMIVSCPQDLQGGRFVQSAEEMRMQDYDAINNRMFMVLDALDNLTC